MKRTSKYPISDIILNRWSPRAMSGEEISDDELMTLFEAARWAPSSYNNQPWRFVYAGRGTKHWDTLLGLLVPMNQAWAKNASALVVLITRNTFEFNGEPSRTHSFDAGSAWENMALQGSTMGLVIHAMEGFDYDKARELLGVPEGHTVEAMVAIGKPGKKEDLPQGMQGREAPSDRKPLEEIIFEGRFGK